jgi:hypothetical protein
LSIEGTSSNAKTYIFSKFEEIEEEIRTPLALLVQGSNCDVLKKINDFPRKLKRDFVQVYNL